MHKMNYEFFVHLFNIQATSPTKETAMTYQGKRARPMANENKRFFEVSKVLVGTDGHISDVLWSEVNAGSDLEVHMPVLAKTAEVVDAIHDGAQVTAAFPDKIHRPGRAFEILEHEDGREYIVLHGPTSAGRDVADMERLDLPSTTAKPEHHNESGANKMSRNASFGSSKNATRQLKTFAVSKVQLDSDGRITAVLWGEVDTDKNDWATMEVMAPVASAVNALHAGDQVFALFSSTHGHLPDRRFVVADYDGARMTIVLDGPSTSEREVHNMDRLDGATVP
jgi:hypothetical protein